MKKRIFLAATVILILTSACAQKGNSKVPESVEKAFNDKFTTVKKVKWEKENEAEWEAVFKMNNVEYSANFESDGSWKETEHAVNYNELPAGVKNTLTTEFSDYKVEASEIVEKADGTVYEVELEKGKAELEVILNAEGKIISKNEEKEDDED